MTYRVDIMPSAQRAFDALPSHSQKRVAQRLRALADDPRPPGIAALHGRLKGSYRLRIGRYRVAYDVDDASRAVTVWQIGHRSKFYEKAKRRRG